MKGIFIPKEFYKVKELNGMERDVLAVYKYYTENGKNKCCSITNLQIADYLNISTRYLNKVKKHLKELGFIRTDGGITVTYLGIKEGTTVPESRNYSSAQEGTTVPKIGTTVPESRNYSSQKKELQAGHKKEKKEKKIKKEIKKEKTNFELILDRLPQDYKTIERMDYLKKNFMDRLNKSDLSGGMFDMALIHIKKKLNEEFPIDYVIPKKEPKIDYVDMF